MPLTQKQPGQVILAADHNEIYQLLKGVAGNGEGITLIYNAAGVVVLQPSSDPAAGTELIQIKNNAGVVQSALTSDGRLFAANGSAADPGISFETEKTTGIYRVGASGLGITLGGVVKVDFETSAVTMVPPLAATLSTAAQPNIITIGKINGSGTRTGGNQTITAGGAYEDVTDVTTTLTLPTGTSGKVLVTACGSYSGTLGGGVFMQIVADGSARIETLDILSSTGGLQPFSITYLVTGLSAGARIFKLQTKCQTNNLTISGGTSALRVTTITAIEV